MKNEIAGLRWVRGKGHLYLQGIADGKQGRLPSQRGQNASANFVEIQVTDRCPIGDTGCTIDSDMHTFKPETSYIQTAPKPNGRRYLSGVFWA